MTCQYIVQLTNPQVITHAMVEHERQSYSECLEVKFALRIAAHTSVYWGASALGQLSIALAFGGCAVLCEVSDTDDFKQTIKDESVNTIGLVPDQLKLLADDPCLELPDMEVVFIWGEKLPVNVAQRWSNHPKARLRELLVSTEYWLSFYSAPLEGLGRHKIVNGVDTLIVDQSGQPVEDGTGELLLHGPMVTTGFIPQESGGSSSFTKIHGKVYFRTRDLVQRWPDGTLEFRGRADMTMKQRGQWVDLLSVESKLQQLQAIEDVAVLPDPAGSSMLHAFIVLKKSSGGEIASDAIADVFREVRRSLPQGRIHTLCSMPRHQVTHKVDVRKLTALAKGHEESWPLNPTSKPDELIANRAFDKVKEHFSWTLVALLTALLWDFRSLASFKRPSIQSILGILLLPYMHLGFLHMVDEQNALGKFVTTLSDMSPLGIWGLMLSSYLNYGVVSWWCDRIGQSHLRTGLRFASMATNLFAGAWTTYGVAQGIRRGRFLTFPIVFWFGIGHRLQYDLQRWCTFNYWKRHFSWVFSQLVPERNNVQTAETTETAAAQPTQEVPENSSEIEPRCSWCCRRMVATWPPPLIAEKYSILQTPVSVYGCNDRMGNPICWSCWVPASKAAGEECSLLAKQLLKDDSVEEENQKDEEVVEADEDTQEAWSAEEKSQYDRWWWKNTTVDYVKLTQSAQELPVGPTPALAELKDPTKRKIYQIVQDVLRTEVTDNMSFHGLDSLMLGLLLGRLRAEFGVSLSISQVRNSSPEQLPQLLEQGQKMQAPKEKQTTSNCEYAVWFSPGQYFPMGGWVLRKDGEICPDKMEQAAHQVVMRHDALRAVPADPLRMLSFVLDTAVMFTLACRLLDRYPFTRWIRRCISWALKTSWARIVVKAPESIYGPGDFPSPLVHICVTDQQTAEYYTKERRGMLARTGNPIDIALIQLHVRLEGLWVYGVNGGMGDFVILEAPDSQLILVDRNRKEAARLCGPTDSGWIPPPYGFPALLSGRLHAEEPGDGTGGVVWLRLKGKNHLAILWRARASAKPRRYEAFHMPGDDLRHRVFNYLAVHAMHIIADGQSYEAIVGDLLALYSADSNSRAPPILANSLAVLQKRLFDALDATDPRTSPQLCSLRGSQWRCSSRGYSHTLGIEKSVLSSLRLAAFKHSVPFDAALLALTAIAVANATAVEELEFTLYVPLRDGVGEAGLCGLFADWRVLSIEVDRATATVLGVVQQVGHKIRTRQWSVYNALKKPEATMVNFQLLDSAEPSSRAGFVQIGEELWRIGECMKEDTRNNESLQPTPQPLSFAGSSDAPQKVRGF